MRQKDLMLVHPDALEPDPKNPRRNEGAVAEVAESIRRFGFGAPIVARRTGSGRGVIIAGHTRWKAARALGLQEVPVRFMDLTEQEARALMLADNKLGEIAEWDDDMLRDVIAELGSQDFDLSGLGWADDDLSELLAALPLASQNQGSVGDDNAPEVQDGDPDSRSGELYQLGPHRLLCGDCRNPEDVARLLDGARINVAFTSPPYASQRKYDEDSGFKPIPPDEYVDWFEAVQGSVREHLADDGSWFVNIKAHSEGGQRHLYVMDLVIAHVRRWGWRFVDDFCWLRPAMPIDPRQNGRFKSGHEPVFWFAASTRPKFNPDEVRHQSSNAFSYADQKAAGKVIRISNDSRGSMQGVGGGILSSVKSGDGLAYPSNVLDMKEGARVIGHSAAFPVSLPSFFIRAYSDPGDIIFDPFLGSGTTLIAAAKHGRIAFGTEISPRYCDLIRRRWTKWARDNGQDPGRGALE